MVVSEREEFVYKAKLAEEAERYEDMVEFMEKVCYATNGDELTEEEINLFALAYNSLTHTHRASWRNIFSIEQKAESRCSNVGHVRMIREYRAKIELEISRICERLLKLLEYTLIPSVVSEKNKVFYLKMKGDYYRYLADFKIGSEKQAAVEGTIAAYEAAQANINELSPTHTTRLSLALNFAVFYYEILGSIDRACNLAKSALDAAVSELDTLCQQSSKETSLILMQILRDNITLWTSDMKDD